MTTEIRVLIVEDDPMVADINKNFTEAVDGFKVSGVAKNGKEALELLRKKQPDLVILDIYLPAVNGVEILSTIRKEEQPVDIIMITAANDTATISTVIRYGITDYIIKPFKFDRYKAALEAYRDFRRKIAQKEHFVQADLDTVLMAKIQRSARDMPKSFSPYTFNSVVDFLSAQTEPLSAEEVAEGVGISRVTARRYLEYLVAQGQLQRVLDYLAVGRPVHRFKLRR